MRLPAQSANESEQSEADRLSSGRQACGLFFLRRPFQAFDLLAERAGAGARGVTFEGWTQFLEAYARSRQKRQKI